MASFSEFLTQLLLLWSYFNDSSDPYSFNSDETILDNPYHQQSDAPDFQNLAYSHTTDESKYKQNEYSNISDTSEYKDNKFSKTSERHHHKASKESEYDHEESSEKSSSKEHSHHHHHHHTHLSDTSDDFSSSTIRSTSTVSSTTISSTTVSSTTASSTTVSSTTASPTTKSNIPPTHCPDAVRRLADGTIKAAAAIQLQLISTEKTLAFSFLLNMLIAGQNAIYSTGEGKQQYYDLLNLDDDNDIRCACNSVIKLITEQDPDHSKAFARTSMNIFGNEEYQFTPEFQKDMAYNTKGHAINLNFGRSKEAASKINKKIRNETSLYYILRAKELHNSDQLIATSALYFQTPDAGIQYCLSEEPFFVAPDEAVPTKFAIFIQEVQYLENPELGAKFIRLPYPGTKFSEIIMLPDEDSDIWDVMNKLGDPDTFNAIQEDLINVEKTLVKVSMIILKTSTILDSKKAIKDAKLLSQIFDPQQAALQNAIVDGKRAGVQASIQRVVKFMHEHDGPVDIETVKRKEYEALKASKEIKEFKANRPYFSFMLVDGIILMNVNMFNPNVQRHDFLVENS